MIVYEATKQLFVEDVVKDRIEENIDRKFYEKWDIILLNQKGKHGIILCNI